MLSRPLGKKVFWHSSAHVLGEAAEKHYGCNLCLGPPTDEGFFYEMAIEDRPVVPADYPNLETLAKGAIKEKQKFERLVMSKEDLLKMFEVSSDVNYCAFPPALTLDAQYNKYKKHFIETKVPDGTSTTVYRCGPMIDLCIGPHIPHTGRIKAMMVTKVRNTHLGQVTPLTCHSRPHLTGLTMPTTTLFNASTVFHSPTPNNSQNIRPSLLRPLGEITARLGKCVTLVLVCRDSRTNESVSVGARTLLLP